MSDEKTTTEKTTAVETDTATGTETVTERTTIETTVRSIAEQTAVAAALRAARRILLWFVLPGFVVLGTSIYVQFRILAHEQNQREHDACVTRAESRTDLRAAIDAGGYDVFEQIFSIFPPDSDEVIKARAANENGRDVLNRLFPPLDKDDC